MITSPTDNPRLIESCVPARVLISRALAAPSIGCGVTYFAAKTGEPRDRSNVLRVLRKVFATTGVPWVGSHTFRRTVACWMNEAGAPLGEIANQLGHADINVTAT